MLHNRQVIQLLLRKAKAIMALRAIIDSWAAHRPYTLLGEDPCSIDSLSVIQIHADVFFHVCKRRFQGTGSAKRKCIVMVISAGGHDTFLHFVENCRIRIRCRSYILSAAPLHMKRLKNMFFHIFRKAVLPADTTHDLRQKSKAIIAIAHVVSRISDQTAVFLCLGIQQLSDCLCSFQCDLLTERKIPCLILIQSCLLRNLIDDCAVHRIKARCVT